METVTQGDNLVIMCELQNFLFLKVYVRIRIFKMKVIVCGGDKNAKSNWNRTAGF